jgi:hypothetical protein
VLSRGSGVTSCEAPSISLTPRVTVEEAQTIAQLDLTREPVVISVPNTQGRYYLLQMLDMWMDSFAGVGKRTTGTEAGDFAVVGPDWLGKLAQGMQRINAPTPSNSL